MTNQEIRLPKPPNKLDLALLVIGRLIFWTGLFVLFVFIFVNSGSAQSVLSNVQILNNVLGTEGTLSASTTYFPATVKLDTEILGTTPLHYSLAPSYYTLEFIPNAPSIIHNLKIPIVIKNNSVTAIKAQIGTSQLFSSYWIAYSYATDNGTYVIIQSSPIGAQVYRNTELIGTTPLTLYNVKESDLNLTIKHSLYEPQQIVISPQQNTTTVVISNLYRSILKQ